MEFFNILLILIGVLGIYITFLRGIYFLKKKDIEYTMPIPIFGNMAPFVFRRTSIIDMLNKYYNKYEGLKYFGFIDFTLPTIVIRDPELFASIAIKNFDSFTDHYFFIDSRVDPLLGKNLFNLNGDTWRDMRKILSPSFTLSKMKMMFELIRDCTESSTNFIANEAKTGKEYEMRNIMNRYTTDVVASCAFGISIDSMKDPENEFYVLASKALNMEGFVILKMFLTKSFPFLGTMFGMRMFEQKVADFFRQLVSNSVKTREEKGIVRPDMIQLLMDGKKDGTMNLDIDDMTAQAFVFFLAGFEATSTILSFGFHEMALNPDIQETLRNEIDEVMKETNGLPSYDTIMNMKYLNAVVTEILRAYPLMGFLDRVCTKEFELPPSKPGGKSIVLEPGTRLWVLPYSMQHDPNYYSNPEKFDPGRFLDNKPEKSTFLSFGLGPRACIASRFALMELKAMMFYFLAKIVVEPCARTSVPITFGKKSFLMRAEKGFWLKVKNRKLSAEQKCTLKA